MRRRFCCLLFSLLLAPAAVGADGKTAAVEELLRVFGADSGDVGALLAVRHAVNDALFAAAGGAFAEDSFPVWGKGDGLIIEFSDYQCGYCRRMFPLLQKAAEEGEARMVIVEFPILGPLSEKAARYALAAQKQGRYDDLHARLMSGGRLSQDSLNEAAKAAGLDLARLREDADSAAVSARLEKSYQVAELFDVSSTPTFIVNGVVIRGAMQEEDFRRLLKDSAAPK